MKNNSIIHPLFVIFFSIMIIGCTQLSPAEQKIYDNLNKKVNLEMFQSFPVHHRDTIVNLKEDLLKKYSFISIVYLKDGCAPCYPAFIEWHKAVDSFSVKDYTVLFVIEGNSYSSYENLILNVEKIKKLETKFYTVIDPNFYFLDGNKDIPYNIIERSLLINDASRIKLIGKPFSSESMKELFFSIVKN